ncbi:prepilin peptidase [Peptoniphilus sp.]|jgi:leader peptidase (prepilin peptidase)/N-methyltransferase|uniref:prepilin peptidase n=1 Tax=Peptoniphilus sp. TaxID=1971214 RepID=UPI003D948951
MNNIILLFIYFLIFIFGASISSFYQLFYYRREKGEDFIFKRSYCENCNETLKTIDLIPVFSYLINRGRCRYCGGKIGREKFILELVTGLLSLLAVLKYGLSIRLIFIILEVATIISIGYIDLSSGYIYNLDVFILFITEFISKIYFGEDFFVTFKLALVLGVIFFLIYFFTGMMGLGDVIYSAAIGFICKSSYEVLLFFNISFISAAIASVVLIILKKKKMKDSISFGPYMSLATVAILFLR